MVKAERHVVEHGTPPTVGTRHRVLDDKTRLTHQLDKMFALLHNEMTVRQASDVLDLPTATVREWLAMAGISIGNDGRLAMPEHLRRQKPTESLRRFVEQRGGSNAVSTLHEAEQAGYIRRPDCSDTRSGPAHRPTFTVTIATRLHDTGEAVSAAADGHRKPAAKKAAAQLLLDALCAASGKEAQ